MAPIETTLQAPLLAAYRRERPQHVPVWFQRQAGRSLPEYRALRSSATLLDLCADPELAAEVTLQPVRRHGVDAAILFSDIVLPLAAIGIGVDIRPGVGPVMDEPIRSVADIARVRAFEPETDAPYVAETIRILVRELPAGVPLIGFAGAPFTLASYLVEGGPSKTHSRTKAMMLSEPAAFGELLERLADMALASLGSQVAAGARAVQVFDSWVGTLTAEQYERHVLPSVTRLFDGLAALGVPRAHFGVGTGHLLELLARTGADVLGIDWRTPLDEAALRIGPGMAIQGNLDPAVCLAPWEVVEREVRSVLDRAPRSGYVFNLGHGVLPDTPPETLTRIVELVHAHGGQP